MRLEKKMNKYLIKGWIRLSTSPYGAHIILYKKKIKNCTICIDYRALNQQTRPEKYPLPRINDLLDQLVNIHCLFSIDLHTSYH